MNNVSIIMARGIEGCGVTKYTIEQIKWLRKNNYNIKVYASKDKSFSRKNSHAFEDINLFKFSDMHLLKQMIDECNNSDVIIINSLPAKSNGRGKGAGDEALTNWIYALKSFKKPVVLIQHDHTIYSIKRNGALDEAIENSNIVFAHSTKNDFSEYVYNIASGGPLGQFFGEINNKKILSFQPGFDFEGVRKKYWKSIEEQDSLHHKWIGRTTSWKGFDLMFKWHNEYLMPNGYLTTLEGIEKSPAYLAFKELSDYYDHLADHPDIVDLTDRYGKKATVFSTFINDELLHRMSRCGFGYQLSILKPKYIEKSIEYTHCEIVAAGAIPVFRKEYGDACIHRITGDPLTKSKNNYTVWLDKTNCQEVIEQIKLLSNDIALRDEWREGAFEFYKNHQDSDLTFADLFKNIKDKI